MTLTNSRCSAERNVKDEDTHRCGLELAAALVFLLLSLAVVPLLLLLLVKLLLLLLLVSHDYRISVDDCKENENRKE